MNCCTCAGIFCNVRHCSRKNRVKKHELVQPGSAGAQGDTPGAEASLQVLELLEGLDESEIHELTSDMVLHKSDRTNHNLLQLLGSSFGRRQWLHL